MKILLVEDDLEISKLLAEFLQENGYEVFCQYDGLHVLDCLRENIGVGLARGTDANGLECWYCVQLFLRSGYSISAVDKPATK